MNWTHYSIVHVFGFLITTHIHDHGTGKSEDTYNAVVVYVTIMVKHGLRCYYSLVRGLYSSS